MGPAFPLFLAMGGLVALVVALGRREAIAAPSQNQLPASPLCTPVNMAFIRNVLNAARGGKATIEMLDKAIELAQRCSFASEETELLEQKRKVIAKVKKQRQTGKPPKPSRVTKETKDFACGTLPGKGFACRPKNKAWRIAAKAFQKTLNVATTKTPGPRETAKLISVDGQIGPKTSLLFSKILPFVPTLSFLPFPATVAKPENIAINLEGLTKHLRDYINSRGGSPSIPSESDIKSAITGAAAVSPLPGVLPQQWMEFMRCMLGRGPKNGLGMFKLSPARLKAIGITRMPMDKRGQIEVFALCMRECGKQILASPLKDFIGQEVTEGTGVPVTLSGVMALCKCAGPKGALSWLENPEERERFPNTSEAFVCTNGIF